MPTNTLASRLRSAHKPEAISSPAQKVVIVNGTAEIMDVLESVLDAGNYDMVFVESAEHAYSQIRRVRPHLVILCADIDVPESLQVLSMLKLDSETRSIPVLTFTIEQYAPETEAEDEIEAGPEMLARRPAPGMN